MTWLYKGEELSDDKIPEKAQGFVYLITHNPTGMRYIGRKLLTCAHRRQKNKKVIKSRVESDWKDYWSSSPEIARMISEEGKEPFTREILLFCDNRSQLNYAEECCQYYLGVLESTMWINGNIRSKVFKRLIIDKPAIVELRNVLKTRF